MHAKSTVAAALLTTPLVSAAGVTIKNACDFTIYYTPVSNYDPTMSPLAPGKTWSSAYTTNPNGGGVSIKMSTQNDAYSTITQLEYTADTSLWYDMSNINGNPFQQWGMTLTTSNSACNNVLCKVGVEDCAQAYNNPWENQNTNSCGVDTDLNLILCSGQDNEDTPVTNALGSLLHANAVEHKHKHKHHNKHHNNSEHEKHHNKHHNKHHDKHHHKNHHHNKDPAPVPAPAPAPVPASVPAPVAPVPSVASVVTSAVVSSAPNVAYATTMLTQYVTVTARDAKPSAAPAAHANVHKHHFHRHS